MGIRRLFGLAPGMCGAFAVLMSLGLSPAMAQSDEPLSTIDKPVSDVSAEYGEATRGYPIRAEISYSDDDRFVPGSNQRLREARVERTRPNDQPISGSWGVLLIVCLLLVGLFIWLKFGGSGTLLSREPREMKPTTAPEHWKLGQEDVDVDGRVLISRLREMTDRKEALIQLLRHALLAGGENCATRFARADTEREAFARLPKSWEHSAALAAILRTTELAHYGGRDVTDGMFDSALAQGEVILMTRKGRRHAG